MMTKLFFLVSITLQLISFSSQSENQKPPTAVQAELTNYGFPIGLLPASVKKLTLNQTSGEFSVDLSGACQITLPPDNYIATYSKRVRGKIVEGRIAELDGIRVRALFQWWSITGISVRAGTLLLKR
ncbi:hypothetical protein OIU76_010384 [Salix suchowensis]|nr:hypothetical protein OIU76_010384 [Salix suchowensis]